MTTIKKYNYFLQLFFCSLLFVMSYTANATVVVITPHPDDAEASCGGLIANTIASGERVIIITMTGGELGIGGKTNEEARLIREKEARNAAAILGAEIIFFGAVDASLVSDATNTEKLKQLLLKINPTIVTAPWPMDVHPDHQATGMLAWRVFQDNQLSFQLFFYETTNSPHTKSFQFIPTDYVDITSQMEKKKQAVYQHKSQGSNEWYGMYEILATVRGYEADVPFAEAYIRANNSSGLGGRSIKTEKNLSKKK